MKTDHAFNEIFGRHPEWLSEVIGKELPPTKTARPAVFKDAKVECDLQLEPTDPSAPHTIIEFQLYYDAAIFNRTDLARCLLWKRLNPAKHCARTDYTTRDVNAVILFGDRRHFPKHEVREHIHYVFLEDYTPPADDVPLAALLRPVFAERGDLEKHAAADYRSLISHPSLDEKDRSTYAQLYFSLLSQRFTEKDQKQLQTMIAELVPLQETRVGKDLIAIGREKGREKGLEEGRENERIALVKKLHKHGTTIQEIAAIFEITESQASALLKKSAQ